MDQQSTATESLATPEDLFFNPLDPSFRIDPYPTYERLRIEAPRHFASFGVWVLSKYADCVKVLHDPHTSSDERNSELYQEFIKQEGMAQYAEAREVMKPFLFMDPPDHTRLRGLVTKAFTPRVVDSLRPRMQQIVDGLIDKGLASGQMEIIEEFAYPLPVTVISELLGVPPEDGEKFKGWSRELARALDPEFTISQEELEQRRQTVFTFADYFRGLIEERRTNPGDDLLTSLIAAEDQGDKLTEQELLSTCILLLIAGHETTVNLIGNGMLALLRNPDQMEKLREDPPLSRNTVEEVLRYDPPVQMTARTALEEIDIGDLTLSKGQQVVILLASANRDPDQFPDPNRFDIGRDRIPHIAFSQGIHFCLGAPLARVEGQIALGTIARRIPNMQLATDEPEYKEQIVLRGLAALPVTFS